MTKKFHAGRSTLFLHHRCNILLAPSFLKLYNKTYSLLSTIFHVLLFVEDAFLALRVFSLCVHENIFRFFKAASSRCSFRCRSIMVSILAFFARQVRCIIMTESISSRSIAYLRLPSNPLQCFESLLLITNVFFLT